MKANTTETLSAAKGPKTILESAWQLHTDLDHNADVSVRRHMRLREGVIILGVIATLLAILSDMFKPNPNEQTNETATKSAEKTDPPTGRSGDVPSNLCGKIPDFMASLLCNSQDQTPVASALRILLVIVPITGSVVLAMANKFQEGERWLALKTGAEDVLRVIYLYRTILTKDHNKDQWLEEKLAEIRRDALQKVKGNLALKSYPMHGERDHELHPLNYQQYIDERLDFQIDRYASKIDRTQKVRTRLQAMILILGGIGSLLAAMANWQGTYSLSIWVAFSTALAAALGSWLELRQLDWRVQRGMSSEEKEKVYSINSEKASSRSSIDDPLESSVAIYSHIINELTVARDHWLGLEEKNSGEFYELVLVVERIIWGKDFSLGSQIQTRILEEADDLIEESEPSPPADKERESRWAPALNMIQAGIQAITGIREERPAEVPQAGGNKTSEQTPEAGEEQAVTQVPAPVPPTQESPAQARGVRVQLRPRRVVVLMPAGRKLTPGGLRIDFDNVFSRLIERALVEEGFSIYRWRKDKAIDSIQELLLADIVVADISFDDPDVFYNLAIRHAFRQSGIIHIREAQLRSSFRTFNVRTAEYHCNKYGRIDTSLAAADREAFKNLMNNVSASHVDDNPVFRLLPEIKEPDRRFLKAPSAIDFWWEDDERRERVALAQKQRRIGDILLLADEIRNPLVKEETFREAGQALKDMGKHELALTWFRRGKELNPKNLVFRREEAFSLNRLKRPDLAIVNLESILEEAPGDSESIAYLGRIYKDMWYDSWKGEKDRNLRLQKAFETNHWLIKSFETYLNGYRYDLNRTHPGINAFTLGTVLVYLARQCEENTSQDAYVEKVSREILPELKGALTFAIESKIRNGKADYRSLMALAELQALSPESAPQDVKRAYHKALIGTRRTLFGMQSSLRQLEMIQLLEMRGVHVESGIEVLKAELRSMPKEDDSKAEEDQDKPRKHRVFLFNRATADDSGKMEEIFSHETAERIRQETLKGLDDAGAKEGDLAITTGMGAGSEIIFVQCCTERGISVQVYFPEPEAKYISTFVKPWGDDWVDLFHKMRNHRLVDEYYQQSSVGAPRKDDNPFERNTRWARYYAQVYGGKDYILITVGEPKSDAPIINFGTIKNKERNGVEPSTESGEVDTADAVETEYT